MKSRPIERDARDFDTTSLHEGNHGRGLSRDYTAHWHRWSFARRFIRPTDHVLEIGCGTERPLWRMLFHGTMPRAASYVGVDYNPLSGGVGMNHQRSTILGGFDFTKDWRNLLQYRPAGAVGYDVAVCLEVIEHMKVEHGKKLLHGAFQLLRPGGFLLLSTPVYDGVRHAANHIHEYTVSELRQLIEKAGFVVEERFGTFMDLRALKAQTKKAREFAGGAPTEAIRQVQQALGAYYDNDAISCIFAPLFPDHARNNLWVLRKLS